MKRVAAVLLAASLVIVPVRPAACAPAQAAGPFEEVPAGTAPAPPHRWAYLSLAAGAGLVGLSFALTDRANRAYDEYLVATAPGDVGRLYDRAVRYDRWSATALLTGEALVATGVWLRFLHRPASRRLSFAVAPDRCAVSLRF